VERLPALQACLLAGCLCNDTRLKSKDNGQWEVVGGEQGESMTILLSVLLNRELPILVIQVLWLNMINSITMTVPLSFEPSTGREMTRPPRDPDANLLSPRLLQRILLVSVFNWILIFGVFEYI